jgi:hypothetical protein
MTAVDVYCSQFNFEIQRVVDRLRSVILDTAPGVTEHLKYGVPYYRYSKAFCYISVRKKKDVYVGIIKGSELSNDEGLLSGEDLKVVRHFEIKDKLSETEENNLYSVLQEALMLY